MRKARREFDSGSSQSPTNKTLWKTHVRKPCLSHREYPNQPPPRPPSVTYEQKQPTSSKTIPLRRYAKRDHRRRFLQGTLAFRLARWECFLRHPPTGCVLLPFRSCSSQCRLTN